ncbi:MAG: NifB/NifX family molybdenum-iron cluster-binding protein [Fusobacterium sp. JB021]|nr:NifB/NifX family molybdenum-iron cluster-binding protein [Fusobacterium sp. JB020]MDP0494038.1 NifB/NifX family molybdenum-iron cluster-binding protein [Fusobacterium sp. JB021]MDP0507343.1 NifB/NifX family molybdenum-iron cluster-binding protein [Fusobacterium sp. JB019]
MAVKVVFPTNDEVMVEQHFGHCAKFCAITVEDGKVIKREIIPAPEHQPGVFPKFLGAQGADVIVTGGMGQRAVDLFHAQDIKVFLGATGTIEDNLNELIKGQLISKGSACTHEHGEHDHN